MSYDIYVQIDTGGAEPATVADVGNMTGNVAGIWDAAVRAAGFPGRFREIHGYKCGDVVEILERAVAWACDPTNEAKLSAMEPANGWGSLDGAREYLQKTLTACKGHPKAVLYFST